MFEEMPMIPLNLNYFVLAIFDQRDSLIYRVFKGYFMQSKLDMLANGFYQLVEQKAMKAVRPNRELKYDTFFNKILTAAEEEMKGMGATKINSGHVFLAIMSNNDKDNKIKAVFQQAGLSYTTLKRKLEDTLDNTSTMPPADEPSANKKKGKNSLSGESKLLAAIIGDYSDDDRGKDAIHDFCVDVSEQVNRGKIDRLIGRQKEMDSIIRIIAKRKKNNVILVGDGGCGKTIIAENLAYYIKDGNVPPFLRNKTVLSLDYTSIINGTMYRGMLEERVKKLLDQLKRGKDYILLIDNIDTIISDGKGSDGFGVGAMFSKVFDEGDIIFIGTCNHSGYRNVFEKNSSLENKFQKVNIDPPSKEECTQIIRGIIPTYEEYHKVSFDENVIEAIVGLSEKYLSEKKLPSSAIDLIDELGAMVSIRCTNPLIAELQKEIQSHEKEIAKLKSEDNYGAADELTAALSAKRIEYAELMKKEGASEEKKKVTLNDVLSLVAMKTGIPTNRLSVDEKERIRTMNERIKQDVIGQDEAIDKICKAIKRNRVGLRNGRNYGTFLLQGNTGVGKTLLAKKLAKEVFGDEEALIRFDMSEYSDKTSVNKLIGSNPGFVGYEEGGRLTEAVKNKKYCVILLDEIEKADNEVYNVFLQVFDEGFLTDNSGRKVDFRNTIILMTSNVGARSAAELGTAIGFNNNQQNREEYLFGKELKEKFPPEFINRIDDVILFKSLGDDDLKKIVRLEANKSVARLADMRYIITYGDDVVDHIFELVQKDRKYGARPIVRAIQNEIDDVVCDAILNEEIKESTNYHLSISEGRVRISPSDQ